MANLWCYIGKFKIAYKTNSIAWDDKIQGDFPKWYDIFDNVDGDKFLTGPGGAGEARRIGYDFLYWTYQYYDDEARTITVVLSVLSRKGRKLTQRNAKSGNAMSLIAHVPYTKGLVKIFLIFAPFAAKISVANKLTVGI